MHGNRYAHKDIGITSNHEIAAYDRICKGLSQHSSFTEQTCGSALNGIVVEKTLRMELLQKEQYTGVFYEPI